MRAMQKLAAEYWEGTLRANPRTATYVGDHRYDGDMEDPTPEGKAREEKRLSRLAARVEAVPLEGLGAEDRLTLAALRLQIRNDQDALACNFEEWNVDPLGGPQSELLNMADVQTVTTVEHGKAMVARWHKMGPYIDAVIANLRRGLAANRVATRDAAAKVVAQLDEILGKPIADWALMVPAKAAHDDWPAGALASFRDGLARATAGSIEPAFQRLRALVRDEVLPRTRSAEEPGLCHMKGGLEAYRKQIRIHTSLDLAPDEIHATGLAEVARIKDAMEALGSRLFGVALALPALRERIARDPTMFFATREEVREKAESTLRRAEALVPRFFGLRPKTPCVVKPMEPHEEKFSTIAFYRPPAADGSRPGAYLVNTYLPETRPRYEAQALAFHEAVPGHHLQIAIAQELTGLPEFRKHTGITAYVEGWALYCERLADEMGLYDGDRDRLGMLSFDAWRACRLVVDTGLHALGWTRRRAIDFMVANTLLAENNIVNEVDRYIVWPGQALAYKTGQLEILRLRAEAMKRLGADFDLHAFHDRVLEAGAVSLPILRERIGAWLSQPARPESPSN
jgi:uncharacterized protein (DUF885 family)